MYKQFYGFKGEPFDKAIQPERLYMHKDMEELVNRFEYIKKQ